MYLYFYTFLKRIGFAFIQIFTFTIRLQYCARFTYHREITIENNSDRNQCHINPISRFMRRISSRMSVIASETLSHARLLELL